jgi:phage FluMu protein Com
VLSAPKAAHLAAAATRPASSLGKSGFTCVNCDRTYSNKHALKTHLTHGTSGCKWTDCDCSNDIELITDVRGGGNHLRFFKIANTRETRSGIQITNSRWLPEPTVRQSPGGQDAIDTFFTSDYFYVPDTQYLFSDSMLFCTSDWHVQHEQPDEHRCVHCSQLFDTGAALDGHLTAKCPRAAAATRQRKSATVRDVHFKWRRRSKHHPPVLMDR